MTRDDIIRMAREAGFSDASELELNVEWTCVESEIKHFANLVAAAEREACAQVCEAECIGFANDDKQLNRIAAVIRARGKQ